MIHDYLIIGSGASGSVIGYRLAEAGADCLMLEAGKDLGPKTYPRDELRTNTRLFWGGGSDFTTDAKTVLLRGKVLGGGTVVNNCLLDRFDDIALDDWVQRSGISDLSRDAITPYYERAESHLDLYEYQRQDWNGNAELYAKAFDTLGFERGPLRRGENNCGGLCESGQGRKNDCIVCLGGCPRRSKQGMAVNYLPQARQKGLQLETEFTVEGIVHGKHHVAVHGRQRGEARVVYARQLVLAAGALGSTELLLKSGFKEQLPALGERFFCHPQFMSVGFMNEPVDAHKGALQSLKSTDPRFRQQGFKLENVFAGPIAMAMLHGGHGYELMRHMGRYRHMACIEVALRDEEAGTIQLASNGRLNVSKPLKGLDRQKAKAGNRVVKDLLGAMGAYEIHQSPLQIGLHLMGGCAIGENAQQSVVTPEFKIYGLENIYLADGAVYPSAPGINPSLTIMALGHKAADQILAERGQRTAALDTFAKEAQQ
ncbi:glucose-methanol-choline oxidoreductase [gamma proteobacterium HTCC5015]|nr:glucose-methanol-choline oxidoreductase [gamma proteobacterium HTCC5015]